MLKRSPLNRVGVKGKANIEANKRLKRIFEEMGQKNECEIRIEGCLKNWTLGFAHRHRRNWYNGDVDKLSDYKQVLISCASCHEKIDRDNKLLEAVFKTLRGDE